MRRHGKSSRWSSVLILSVCAAAILWSRPSVADGALAIGIPAGGAINGLAGGNALGAQDMNTASDRALAGCKKSIGASDAAKKACSVIATFKDQCYAIALDPQDGTPGAGWGIAETLNLAEEKALQQCHDTAGTDREKFCTVIEINHGCDGKHH